MRRRLTGIVMLAALFVVPALSHAFECSTALTTWELRLVGIERVDRADTAAPPDAVVPPSTGELTIVFSDTPGDVLIHLHDEHSDWEGWMNARDAQVP